MPSPAMLALLGAHKTAAPSGFNASDWGTAIHEWDTSKAGAVHATGSTVDTWDDLIGSATMTMHSGAKPTTGTDTLGGKNVFTCSGAYADTTTTDGGHSQPYTVAFVAKLSSGTPKIVAGDGGVVQTSTVYRMFAGSFGNYGTYTTGVWAVHVCIFNAASSRGWLNGVQSAALNVGTATKSTFAIGASGSALTGNFAHLVAWSGAVADPGGLSAALNTYWGGGIY